MIYVAPLQGYTDLTFRRVFQQHFSGADAFFIPYISLKNGEVVNKQLREIRPENNGPKPVVPQVLFSGGRELTQLLNVIRDFGHKQANLNLGCPFPMVANRGRGAGLLPFPEKIEEALYEATRFAGMEISVKLRLGLKSPDEIYPVAEVLNRFALKEIICHPRVASQLYKGEINETAFGKFLEISKNPVAYNGDIFSFEDFKEKQQKFPQAKNLMLGRGLIMNPFLAEEISGICIEKSTRLPRLKKFHADLLENYSLILSGPGHLLPKMNQFWEYFSYSFSNPAKASKSIKKAHSLANYTTAVNTIFEKESGNSD